MQINTRNTTYTLDFSKVVKTTPKQRREQIQELKYMAIQKSLGIVLTALSIVLIAMGGTPALLLTFLGLYATFTNEHVLNGQED